MAEATANTPVANRIVKNYMLAAAGVGIVPVPLWDLALLTGLQLKMLHSLANLYEVEFSAELAKSLLGALCGSGSAVLLSYNLSGLTRLVPFAGNASVALFGSASTYAVGKVFIQHFASGGTFLTFDPQQVKGYFEAQFKQGNIVVAKGFAGVKP